MVQQACQALPKRLGALVDAHTRLALAFDSIKYRQWAVRQCSLAPTFSFTCLLPVCSVASPLNFFGWPAFFSSTAAFRSAYWRSHFHHAQLIAGPFECFLYVGSCSSEAGTSVDGVDYGSWRLYKGEDSPTTGSQYSTGNFTGD